MTLHQLSYSQRARTLGVLKWLEECGETLSSVHSHTEAQATFNNGADSDIGWTIA